MLHQHRMILSLLLLQGSTDAVREAADIVLTEKGLGCVLKYSVSVSYNLFNSFLNFCRINPGTQLSQLCSFTSYIFHHSPLIVIDNNTSVQGSYHSDQGCARYHRPLEGLCQLHYLCFVTGYVFLYMTACAFVNSLVVNFF